MLKGVIQLFFIILGGIIGYQFGSSLFAMFDFWNLGWLQEYANYVGAGSGALIFLVIGLILTNYILQFIQWVEERIVKLPLTDLVFGMVGLIMGLVITMLLPLDKIPLVGNYFDILFAIVLGYLGFQVGFRKKEEIISLFSLGKKSKHEKNVQQDYHHKILDTSVIIDGRIADICQTGFLEGVLVIPHFVLEELQHIADSSDVLKRNRGRRGLDILNKIQKELPIEVIIYEGDFEEIAEVDSKLVKLAKVLGGKVVTNDFNLNKVCELQGVPVLNINDLANAVKPVVLPGEELNVQVIKDGKEDGQGVAYLDDGTMIVVEDGRNNIGKHIDVIVTSVLQTSAGRMIFAKPKAYEKAL
ncbi:PIN/TRAM domain-containing protein [Rubeoparvulum massiliense]|uniref:PIN/TRAM domain-containing protein n=1 Tax=Rubeoparvulum massiliense TaxID=1631346 RepID=UPI00065DDD54|nr:PIN/TRAM domain-containing protein [Rubeoparvulum massiliense]